MRRLAALLLAAALLAPAAPARAQSSPFGPLPPAAPTPTPSPAATTSSGLGGDVGRATLYTIGGALLVTFAVIGVWIARDARRSLPGEGRELPGEAPSAHDRGVQRQRAKQQARSKARAQKAARRKNR